MTDKPETKQSTMAVIRNFIFRPLHYYAIVEEDKFRSGYECTKCDGEGVQKCRHCEAKLEEAKTCKWCTKGYVTCTQCSGKGSLIEIPETAQRRPTTGIVRAISEDFKAKWLLGKRVLYSNFAGTQISIPGDEDENTKIVVCILDENEIKCVIEGTLSAKDKYLDLTTAS